MNFKRDSLDIVGIFEKQDQELFNIVEVEQNKKGVKVSEQLNIEGFIVADEDIASEEVEEEEATEEVEPTFLDMSDSDYLSPETEALMEEMKSGHSVYDHSTKKVYFKKLPSIPPIGISEFDSKKKLVDWIFFLSSKNQCTVRTINDLITIANSIHTLKVEHCPTEMPVDLMARTEDINTTYSHDSWRNEEDDTPCNQGAS